MAARDNDGTWRGLLRLARWADMPALVVGEITCWLQIPLVLLIVFDAFSRRYFRSLSIVVDNNLHFFFNSPAIQDGEWHLHTIIFFGALGYAFTRSAHVRLDIVRPRLSGRQRLWIELLGGLLLMLPFVAIFAADAWTFFWSAWVHDESAGDTNGIGNRWFIKFFIFFGPVLLFLAGVSMLLRLYVRLFGPPHLSEATDTKHISDPSFSAFN